MAGGDFKVVMPMTANEVEELADATRRALRLADKNVRMEILVEVFLREALPGYFFEVLPDDNMPGLDGLTPVGGVLGIYLSETIYDAMCVGSPDARMVAAHEFGHLMMHSHQMPALAKRAHDDVRVDPEWQADRFAEFFMMPRAGVAKCRSSNHVAAKYGVPDDVAERRFAEVTQIQGELFG